MLISPATTAPLLKVQRTPMPEQQHEWRDEEWLMPDWHRCSRCHAVKRKITEDKSPCRVAAAWPESLPYDRSKDPTTAGGNGGY